MIQFLSPYTVACGAVLAVGLVKYLFFTPRDGLEAFPGPKRSFLIGNWRNFPKDAWLECFNGWRDEYGDVVYVKVGAMRMLILSSLEDAEELLVRRASTWSARPSNRMVNRFMGFGWGVIQINPGRSFNEMRKVFKKVIGPHSISDYNGLMEQEASKFAHQLEGFSGDPFNIIVDCVGAVIVKMAYGETIYREHGPELIKLNVATLDIVTWALSQLWIVNMIPITRFLPRGTPGLQFPAVAMKGREMVRKVRHWAFDLVKEAHDKGTADFSVVSKYLNEPEFLPQYLRDATSIMYMGGVDTTTSVLLGFFNAMLRNPDIQEKIHKEFDEVVGRGNAPTSSALQSMPYLIATWKETLRLNSPIPTGIPHMSNAEDNWKGKVLPKHTIVLTNIGYMLEDPRLWGEDAHLFRPERFLPEHNPRAKDLPDVAAIPFGFGRRICPGRYIIERNGSIFAAAVLSAYKIVPPEGETVPTSARYTRGQIRRIENLRCRFVPRP